MDRIIIKENKRKSKKIAIAGTGMFLAALLLLYLGIQDKDFLFCLVGGIGSTYFGILFFYNISRAFQERILLILEEDRITDHSTAGTSIDIYYKDIDQVNIISNARGQQFLGIHLKDPDAFLSTMTGLKKQEILQNLARKQPPILIWLDTAEGITAHQVMELIHLRM